MCGISGFFTKKKLNNKKKIIELMNQKLSHRGPDGEGYFADENVCLGHKRLAIIDAVINIPNIIRIRLPIIKYFNLFFLFEEIPSTVKITIMLLNHNNISNTSIKIFIRHHLLLNFLLL